MVVTLGVVGIIVQTHLYNINNTKKIHVACIGDSITEAPKYPNELQNRLGDGYKIGNFGISSSTVLLDTDTPYIYQIEFLEAKDFLPDILVIMLGTNDARTDNFRSIENFVTDYMILISEIQANKNNSQIFLVNPPPIFLNKLYLDGVNFSQEIIPRIEGIADELGLPNIDVYGALEGYPEYFPDGVHPNNEGAIIIATEVYNAIIRFSEIS